MEIVMPAQTETVNKLQEALESTYSCFLITHYCHWNVEGENFASLHSLFNEQYNELFAAIDEIAERIRALGAYPFQSGYSDIVKILQTPPVGKAGPMLKALVELNQKTVTSLQAVKNAAQEAGDDETVDIMIARITAHQKAMWMLKSSMG
jgi:starvation-inducible DNA-binding protein